jgi:hypothetical protein
MRVAIIAACLALTGSLFPGVASANPQYLYYGAQGAHILGRQLYSNPTIPYRMNQMYQGYNTMRQWRPPPVQFQQIVPPQYRHHYAPSVRTYRIW